jgi:F420-non-reducing hydrogenase large subunit
MSIRDAAKGVIKNGEVNDGLLNMVEMAFRAYDPCFGCSTHNLPGEGPMTVNLYDHNQEFIRTIQRL